MRLSAPLKPSVKVSVKGLEIVHPCIVRVPCICSGNRVIWSRKTGMRRPIPTPASNPNLVWTRGYKLHNPQVLSAFLTQNNSAITPESLGTTVRIRAVNSRGTSSRPTWTSSPNKRAIHPTLKRQGQIHPPIWNRTGVGRLSILPLSPAARCVDVPNSYALLACMARTSGIAEVNCISNRILAYSAQSCGVARARRAYIGLSRL